MKLDLKVVPDLATLMAEEIEAAERAVTTGVGEVGVRLKGNWRAQVVGAGLGPRLGNTIRSERYPKQGTSIRAAALVCVTKLLRSEETRLGRSVQRALQRNHHGPRLPFGMDSLATLYHYIQKKTPLVRKRRGRFSLYMHVV